MHKAHLYQGITAGIMPSFHSQIWINKIEVHHCSWKKKLRP